MYLLMLREVLWSLEQAPAGLRQDRLVAIRPQLSDLGPPHLVESHRHVPHDVKAVEYVEGGRDLLRDHIEVLPPHVAVDEAGAQNAPRR